MERKQDVNNLLLEKNFDYIKIKIRSLSESPSSAPCGELRAAASFRGSFFSLVLPGRVPISLMHEAGPRPGDGACALIYSVSILYSSTGTAWQSAYFTFLKLVTANI